MRKEKIYTLKDGRKVKAVNETKERYGCKYCVFFIEIECKEHDEDMKDLPHCLSEEIHFEEVKP